MAASRSARYLLALLALVLALGATCSAGAAQTDPRALFAAVRAASGGDHWQDVGMLDILADVTIAGIHGRQRMRIDLRDGRYIETDDAGPASQSDGYDGRHAWFMDVKGLVTLRDGAYARRQMPTLAYIMRQGWLDAAPPAKLHYLGTRAENGHRYQVVQVTPLNGLPLQVWIDPASHLIASLRYAGSDGQQQITRYADYRRSHGVLLPFSVQRGTAAQPDQEVVKVRTIAVAAAPSDAVFAMPASHADDARMLDGATSTTLPFEEYAGLIVVDVSIDGAAPRPFVFDSGGLNLLTPAAAAALKLQDVGHEAVSGTGPGTASMSMVSVHAMRLGNAELDDQRFYVVPLPLIMTDRGSRQPIAGLIGYEMLRRFVTRIDYDKKLLTLTSPAHFDPRDAGNALTLHFDGRTPQVNAAVNGAHGRFLVDTGSNAKLILTEDFAATHAIHLDGKLHDGVVAGVGGTLHDRDGAVSTFELGGYALPHFATSIVQSTTGTLAPASGLAGNIGGRVLAHFVVTFDYPQRRMYLRPGTHFKQTAARKANAGIGLSRIDHHTLQVIAVDAHSSAARAGIKVGDDIIAIDGISVSDLGLDQIESHLKGPAGAALTITLRQHGNRTRVLKLTRS